MIDRIPDVMELPGGYEAIGVARDGALVGGCLYSDFRRCPGGGTVQIWAAGEGLWISRRVIAVMLGYPFKQLGCHRITALTGRKNKPTRRLLEDLGFKLEGIARRAFSPTKDACIYSLLRDEVRWRLIGE